MGIVQIKATNDQSCAVKKRLMAENYVATQKFSVKASDMSALALADFENYEHCESSIIVTFYESVRVMLEQIVCRQSHICSGFLPKASTMFM